MPARLRPPRISLSNLRPARGSQQNQKRVGRGQASGYGRTSGRGTKGQNSRSGPGPHASFEGGQSPITKIFPKRGFYNQSGKKWAPVNLDRIQHWIDQGRLTSSPDAPITARELLLSGCIHNAHDGVKILGDGAPHFNSKIYITPSRASKSAIRAIEKHGGSVICKYYNPLALRDCLKGRTDRVEAAPTRREDIIWYSLYRNRGYISKPGFKHYGNLPFVQDRWKQLAKVLGKFKKQSFDRQRKL